MSIAWKDMWRPVDPAASTWTELLAVDPLIIHTWPAIGFPMGSASVIGPLVKDRPAHFLVSPAWTLEPADSHRYHIENARSYRAEHPLHRVTYLVNNDRETAVMSEGGLDAITLNQNCFTDEMMYRPLPDVEPIYDAVYNARLSPQKRHELAVEVPRLALIYPYSPWEFTIPEFHGLLEKFKSRMPHAIFLKPPTPDGCEWVPTEKLNFFLAQSRVGLCLSPLEGAMRASIEYLLAGLPLVSTPSIGGRDYFFDDEYCAIAEADPRAVRDAVKLLIARDIPREYVRARTLARLEIERSRYIAFVQSLIDQAGGREKFADHFWRLMRGEGVWKWQSMPEFSKTVLAAIHQ